MRKGFNQDAFINWMEDEFDMNRFALNLVLNIIDYGMQRERVSRDRFCEFVADMIGEIDMLAVAAFCDDGMLTDSTLKALGRK